ncbi:hypothetical protein GGR51DRAFT_559446 [Nemania sp. FL0031]|nr:hypothetical protein GGR51DRAFT_559446 [Nemania sp. FL0031]
MAATTKSSVEEAVSKDADQIIVTLSLRGPYSIPKRRLVFTRTRAVIPIGRSSKVHSKGFVPAEDNAWFENPVMSRQHAQLIANFDEKPAAVYITDVGSFHGTYRSTSNEQNKEQRLDAEELVKLTNGDIIRFGIDIFRAEKSYPPCSVDFSIEEMIERPTNPPHRGFTVPDYIDDEDEDSENEDTPVSISFSKFKVNTIIVQPKSATSIVGSRPSPIDLTTDGDDVTSTIAKLSSQSTTNGKTLSDVIDLTSEPNCDSDVEVRTVNPTVPRPSGFDAPSAPVSSDGRSGSLAPMGLIQYSDGRIVMPPSLALHSDDEGVGLYAASWSDEDAGSVFSDSSEPESVASLGAITEEISPPTDKSSQHHDDTSEVEEKHEFGNPEEELYSSDGISDFDPDSNSEDDDRSLFFNGEDDEDEDESEDATRELLDDQIDTATLLPSSTTVHERTHSETSTAPVTLSFGFSPPTFTPPLGSFTPCNPPHDRDPSPSDAALFKRLPLLDNPPSASRAQQLGEKSGKFEFFAAREKNRAALHQNHSTVPISALRETLFVDPGSQSASPPLSPAQEPVDLAKETQDKVPEAISEAPETAEVPEALEAPDASSIKLCDTDTNQYSAWTVSGDQFINNPPTDEPPASQAPRCQPADFDMTSAYKFQQSKLATVNDTVSKTRRLPIQDLLAQEPKQCVNPSEPIQKLPILINPSTGCASTPSKRSYGEAFDQTEDEATPESASRVAAPCLPSMDEAKRGSQPPQEPVDISAMQSNIVAQNVKEPEVSAQEPTVIFVQAEAHRPAKRMRLAIAAQVVACVALGGAATFSYLVNTAPVF